MAAFDHVREFRCDICGAMPGEVCHIVLGPGAGTPTIEHVARFVAAEEAEAQ